MKGDRDALKLFKRRQFVILFGTTTYPLVGWTLDADNRNTRKAKQDDNFRCLLYHFRKCFVCVKIFSRFIRHFFLKKEIIEIYHFVQRYLNLITNSIRTVRRYRHLIGRKEILVEGRSNKNSRNDREPVSFNLRTSFTTSGRWNFIDHYRKSFICRIFI